MGDLRYKFGHTNPPFFNTLFVCFRKVVKLRRHYDSLPPAQLQFCKHNNTGTSKQNHTSTISSIMAPIFISPNDHFVPTHCHLNIVTGVMQQTVDSLYTMMEQDFTYSCSDYLYRDDCCHQP